MGDVSKLRENLAHLIEEMFTANEFLLFARNHFTFDLKELEAKTRDFLSSREELAVTYKPPPREAVDLFLDEVKPEKDSASLRRKLLIARAGFRPKTEELHPQVRFSSRLEEDGRLAEIEMDALLGLGSRHGRHHALVSRVP